MVGTSLPGEIKRVKCEPYSWTNPQWGEELILDYNYLYLPETDTVVQEEFDLALPEEA